jgi:CBS domain-containing protein
MPNTIEQSQLATASVREVASPGVLGSPPNAPLRAVAEMMVVREVHALAILDAAEPAPAILTDLDLVRAVERFDAARAGDIARRAATVSADDPLIAAAAAMADAGLSHLLVVEPGAGHPAGVLSTLDVAAALAGRAPRVARTIRPRQARPQISTSRLDRVRVAQAMHLGVFVCPPDSGVRDVAAILVDRRVHCVAVAGAPGAALGFVTDIDVVRAAARGEDVRAADLAGEATWVDPEATLDTVAALMAREGTSHVLVSGSHEQQPIGVVSTLDVIDVLAVE